MGRAAVVTCFLRHHGEVLLLRRSDEVGSFAGRWGAVSGYVEGDDPESTARMEIREETGITDPSHVRTGDPFSIREDAADREWRVHPFLFDVPDRNIHLNEETAEAEWTTPTAILRRQTVPALEISYAHVAPTVESVSEDTEHGSAAISVIALEVLRDAAGRAATTNGEMSTVVATAEALLEARPTMAVLRNRVNRAMAGADTPKDVEQSAIEGIERAYEVDDAAAAEAVDNLGDTVVTLSRSGTVRRALLQARPSVVVAESRPAREGVDTAETLADAGLDVTLCTDAAIARIMAERDVDTVVVGADTLQPDGSIVNKTGTRLLALAAADLGVPFLVASSVDKVTHDAELVFEEGDPTQVYDGDADVRIANPTFELTPARLIDGIVTDRGRLAPDEIGDIATEMADLADWQEQESG